MSKPVFFSEISLISILADQKTQTRHILNYRGKDYKDDCNIFCKDGAGDWIGWQGIGTGKNNTSDLADFTLKAYPNGGGIRCPYGKPGDILKIKNHSWHSHDIIKITNVRVERLQNISENDAQAEGVEFLGDVDYTEGRTYKVVFSELWDKINKKPGTTWADNPWVWVLDFELMDLTF